jgi:hypothetical protein
MLGMSTDEQTGGNEDQVRSGHLSLKTEQLFEILL